MILCGGCSFTRYDNVSDEHMWPHYLSTSFNSNNLNVGCAGASNDYIANVVIRSIVDHHKTIEAVFVMWTEWHRLSLFGSRKTYNPSVVYRQHNPDVLPDDVAQKVDTSTEQTMIEKGDLEQLSTAQIVMHNLISMNAVKNICEKYNIKYAFAQGCPAVSDYDKFYVPWKLKVNDILEALSNYESIIDTSKFYEYPIFWQYGGKTISQGVPVIDPKKDPHPNKEGQQIMAKRFYKFYNTLYL